MPDRLTTAVDLRSDTVTRPTPAMRHAIAEAEVGDAVLGDDPTVAALERYAAELLGKDAALFFPSGIMANTTALLVLGRPGTEAVIEAGGHILNYEDGAAAAWGGIQMRAVPTADGLLRPEHVAEYVRPGTPYLPLTSLVCLENTHNGAGGRVMPLAQLRVVAETAHARGVAVHLDGARLPNASVATGVPMAEFAAPVDTVMVALSKGLGAPVGSILAGSAEAMEKAWRVRRRLGGGMRQAGILAAAALHGLRNHFPLLEQDHRRARELAGRAAGVPGLSVVPPETNIVMMDLVEPRLEPAAVLAALERRGVRMTQFGARRLRAVTHLDVDDAGIARAGDALVEAVGELLG
ncbi:GntG family PLP-dependent aldolase [Longimicrobium sp.]|uniref:threonine aldolase family protein n=1 Tax=Longimicrobium sp. TaxID=2029185 RepID=UPI002E337583|nr:GntG family PLP-dependent aldolase [Longimicrobium sp.]HEX6040031.1 GntG family PLP-dependent aldolase [Longimicrobium sp.]